MKRLVIYASVAALFAGAIGQASAQDRRFHRHHGRDRVIIEQANPAPALGTLAVLLMLKGLSEQKQQEPVYQEPRLYRPLK